MRPFSEVDHDHGKLVTNFQRDDDLILHSAMNRGTSTVSQFFIIILGRWLNSKSHSGKTSRPQNTKISHASKFPFYPCGDGSKVGWWGGSARHFLDHHLPSPETLPKKIHFLQTTHRNFPSPSLPPPRPPHRNIPAGLPWPTRGLAILVIRLSAGAASSTPSSTGLDHPRRTSKPYTHPAVYRSRFSCGIVHPTGAASPDPSSTASDLAHRHRCA